MTITAKVIADSLSFEGRRLLTLELFYPRYIHAEFMTHRVFSRNASSSRAIPVKTMRDAVLVSPTRPENWYKNQKGMQPSNEIIDDPLSADQAWDDALDAAIRAAKKLEDLGVHKQWANRLLEPFAHIRVIVTATDWQNFFDLRMSASAQSEIRQLAEAMLAAINGSTPKVVKEGNWHRPYVTDEDVKLVDAYARTMWEGGSVDRRAFEGFDAYLGYTLNLVSAARCARVSYRLHDGREPDPADDIRLAERLLEERHMSPFEHQGAPCGCAARHDNFEGWFSFRCIKGIVDAQRAEQERRGVGMGGLLAVLVQSGGGITILGGEDNSPSVPSKKVH